jgi:DNA-directed RNA polymerase subunit alpha
MLQVQCLQSKIEKPTELYSKYSIGPFTKGQSTTIGNALRRALLSNLNGLAIVGVRINGVNHEFSTIPNVKEDVIDILLNLKQIVIKGSVDRPTVARLRATGAGIINAGGIELSENITLVEPFQYITTLTGDTNLEMEFLIDEGQGYSVSSKIETNLPEGFLSVDAVFMPVKRVNFFIETSRDNTASELESLFLEIWTNGSITPAEALSSSAEMLELTFSALKISETVANRITTFESPATEESAEHYDNIFIEELELSVRAYNCLKRANVHTLADLLKYSAAELLEFKNFGQKSADEVCENLKKRFNMDLRK